MSPGDSEPHARAHEGPDPLDLSSRTASRAEKASTIKGDGWEVERIPPLSPRPIGWRIWLLRADGSRDYCDHRMWPTRARACLMAERWVLMRRMRST